MEGLDLSSLEKGVVEAAALPSQPLEGQTTVIPGSEQPKIQESLAASGAEEVIPPAVAEDVDTALSNIDAIIDENAPPIPKVEEVTSVYPTLATFLKEKGLIDTELEIKDEESFVEAMSKTIEVSKYANLSPSQKIYMEAMEANVDETSVRSMLSTTERLNSVTEDLLATNPELATKIITDDLLAQGWDEGKIGKQIERLIKTEELVTEALASKDSIVKREAGIVETQRLSNIEADKAAKAKQDQSLIDLKDAVFKETKALTTIAVDDRLRNEVYESMTKPVAYTKEGQPMNAMSKARSEDPIAFEKDLYYAWVLTNGFKDLTRQQRRADTNAAKKLKDAVVGLNLGMGNQGETVHTPDAKMPDIVSV